MFFSTQLFAALSFRAKTRNPGVHFDTLDSHLRGNEIKGMYELSPWCTSRSNEPILLKSGTTNDMVQNYFQLLPFQHKRFMPALNLKPSHKVIKDYYHSLEEFDHFGVTHESAVRSAFQTLLEGCGKQRGWKLIPEDSINLGRNKRIVVDGALIDKFKLTHG